MEYDYIIIGAGIGSLLGNLGAVPQFISLYRQEVNIDFPLRFFHHV